MLVDFIGNGSTNTSSTIPKGYFVLIGIKIGLICASNVQVRSTFVQLIGYDKKQRIIACLIRWIDPWTSIT